MNAPDAEGNGLAGLQTGMTSRLDAVARNRPGSVLWPNKASDNGSRRPHGCSVPKNCFARRSIRPSRVRGDANVYLITALVRILSAVSTSRVESGCIACRHVVDAPHRKQPVLET